MLQYIRRGAGIGKVEIEVFADCADHKQMVSVLDPVIVGLCKAVPDQSQTYGRQKYA
ncbi:MAG: hypothetical protein JW849_02210 [Phycisphaerae bacterium]|nr:hypothetical protein [Phycisphaerae bacterium]